MTWFAAHIIMAVKLKAKRQTRIPVWENIVLIEAGSEAEAFAKAEERGHSDEGDSDGTFRWNGQRAEWVFAGVRKLVECEDPEERPTDGTEVSYSQFELSSKQALAKYVACKPIALSLDETIRPEKSSKAPANGHARQASRRLAKRSS
jgi:hypothetical protein